MHEIVGSTGGSLGLVDDGGLQVEHALLRIAQASTQTLAQLTHLVIGIGLHQAIELALQHPQAHVQLGRLLLDGQVFRTLGSSSELDPDEGRSYQVGPDALLTQFKTVELTLLATPSGWAVRPAPALPGLQIDNRLQRDDSGRECPSAARLVSQTVRGQEVSLSGRLPESCDGSHLYVPVFDHARFQSEAFAAAWQKQYGSVAQLFQAIDAAVQHNPQLALNARALRAEHAPLADALGLSLPLWLVPPLAVVLPPLPSLTMSPVVKKGS